MIQVKECIHASPENVKWKWNCMATPWSQIGLVLATGTLLIMINSYFIALLLYYNTIFASNKLKINITCDWCKSVIEIILKPKGMLCNAILD